MAEVFKNLKALEVDSNLLHRVVVAEEANARQGTHSARTRSETRGGGRKPYKQKKTGNARQGTIRAPHYAHGGMAFAIKPRDYSKKVNKKERRLAMAQALAEKVQGDNIVVCDKISIKEPKTAEAVKLLGANGLGETRRVLVVLGEHDAIVLKSFRNLPNVVVRTVPSTEGKGEGFSTRDLIVAHKILMDKAAAKALEGRYTAKETKS
ncbi:MAG: 50S ribosomal protein L4 [Fimbriimonadaceae bacterium]|nr:50S ribosomal protein L4 [Fimbriimonadaceae bacterium]